jgi:hypothetical protein
MQKTPYLQVNRPVREGNIETLHGVYRPIEGVLLSCEGALIESDALPDSIYHAIQSRLKNLLGKDADEDVPQGQNLPCLTEIIDLKICGYDPLITDYNVITHFGTQMVSIETSQPTVSWSEMEGIMAQIIANKGCKP